jgi:hypothetical protein
MAAMDKRFEADTFRDVLASILGFDVNEYRSVLDELWNAYDTYYKNEQVDPALLPDLIVGKKGANGQDLTPLFNKEFAAYLKIKNDPNDTTGITSLGDFVGARNQYRSVFQQYGIKDLATNENIDKFLEGQVSPLEAQARMASAFQAVEGADSILRSQLGELNLTGKELARALLLGKDGAIELENRLKTANVMAGEVEAGIKSQLGAGELARQNVTRNEAARGLARTKEQLSGYEQEAKRQGQDVTSVQTELEKENVLGMASQRRKKLQQSGVARFSGTSGIMQGSLKKNSARSN